MDKEEKGLRRYWIFLILLAGIFVLFYVGKVVITVSQQRTCIQNINMLHEALDDYYSTHLHYPDKLRIEDLTLLRPPLPKDPATGKEYIYEVSEDRQHYKLSCPNPEKHKVKEIFATETQRAKIR